VDLEARQHRRLYAPICKLQFGDRPPYVLIILKRKENRIFMKNQGKFSSLKSKSKTDVLFKKTVVCKFNNTTDCKGLLIRYPKFAWLKVRFL
jgi:hypothetical protein